MILNELRKNARVSLLEVAKKTNIPLSTVYDKVRNYEGEIIKKHTSIIDFQNLGYHARRIIALKVKKENKENRTLPETMFDFKTISGYWI